MVSTSLGPSYTKPVAAKIKMATQPFRVRVLDRVFETGTGLREMFRFLRVEKLCGRVGLAASRHLKAKLQINLSPEALQAVVVAQVVTHQITG